MWPDNVFLRLMSMVQGKQSENLAVRDMLDRYKNSAFADSLHQVAKNNPDVVASENGGLPWIAQVLGPLFGYDRNAGALATYHPMGNTINFATQHLVDAHNTNGGQDYTDDTFSHEMGHAAERGNPAMFKEWQKETYGRKGEGYAATNEHERFAEAFNAAIYAMRQNESAMLTARNYRIQVMKQEQETPGIQALLRMIGSTAPYNQSPMAKLVLRNAQ